VVKFSKKFSLKDVRENLGVKIKTKKQNKTLDLIIKTKDKILLCEAKHLNTSGGGQDKQLSELIEIMGLKEKNGGEKITKQKKEIDKFLKNNPNNYWLNTAGFEKLISDLK